jgi:uncharacterized protein
MLSVQKDQKDSSIKRSSSNGSKSSATEKSFQAFFCIDERECSIRRHIEHVDPSRETLGTPGFFEVEFYFQPENGKFYDKLCPAPVTPKYLIKEFNVKEHRKHEILYSNKTHDFLTGILSSLTLGFWAGVRKLQNLFFPRMSPAISNASVSIFYNLLSAEGRSTFRVNSNRSHFNLVMNSFMDEQNCFSEFSPNSW